MARARAGRSLVGETTKTQVERSDGRVKRLRVKMLRQPSICLERAILMTQSYMETKGDPFVVRRARGVEKVLKEMTISIGDEELIVGNATTKQPAAPLYPEIDWRWYVEDMGPYGAARTGHSRSSAGDHWLWAYRAGSGQKSKWIWNAGFSS